jgi:urease accessory protein
MMSGRTTVLSPTPDRLDDALDPSQLYRLMAWLSPSFPVGAFSYSSGLEWAVEAGDVTDAETLQRWLRTVIAHGNGFCDGIFFGQGYRAAVEQDEALLHGVAELAAAFTPSKERQLETTAQGQAFLQTVRAAWSCAAVERFAASWSGAVAYPVAVAVTAAGHGIPLGPALHAYLHAVAANLISAGVRLIPLGQTDGQRLLAALQEIIEETGDRALAASLDDLGSAAFRVDLAGMRHESQYTRLFRS